MVLTQKRKTLIPCKAGFPDKLYNKHVLQGAPKNMGIQ